MTRAGSLAAGFWLLRVVGSFVVVATSVDAVWVARAGTIGFVSCFAVVVLRQRGMPRWGTAAGGLGLLLLAVSQAIRIGGGTVDFAEFGYFALGVWFLFASRSVSGQQALAATITGAGLMLTAVGLVIEAPAGLLAAQIVAWPAYAVSAMGMVWWAYQGGAVPRSERVIGLPVSSTE